MMNNCFRHVSRALVGGATGAEAFTLLLRSLSNIFDSIDMGASYTKFVTFSVPNGTLFRNFSRTCRGVVSAATGAGNVVFALGLEIDLEVVRMEVNEQYPSLIPRLY